MEVLVDDVNVSDSAAVGCCQNVVESKGAVNEDGSAVLEGWTGVVDVCCCCGGMLKIFVVKSRVMNYYYFW